MSLQSTLARAKAHADWKRLSERIRVAQEEIIRVCNDSKHAYYDTDQMVRMVRDELEQPMEGVRRAP